LDSAFTATWPSTLKLSERGETFQKRRGQRNIKVAHVKVWLAVV
jgi:hypothetical protein